MGRRSTSMSMAKCKCCGAWKHKAHLLEVYAHWYCYRGCAWMEELPRG